MSRILTAIAVTGIFLLTIVEVRAGQFDIRGAGVYYSPIGAAATGGGGSDLNEVKWNDGTGIEAQGIYWTESLRWGGGVSIGTASWNIDDYDNVGYIGYAYGDYLTGDADFTMFGLSAFYSLFKGDGEASKWSGTIEGGVKYVSVDSNIEGAFGVGRRGIDQVWLQTLEIDDSILGFVGFDVSYALTKQVDLFAQGGFQFDLDKGAVDNETNGRGTYEAGKTELAALYGKAGVAISF